MKALLAKDPDLARRLHVHLFVPSSFYPSRNKLKLQDEQGDNGDIMTLLNDWEFVRVQMPCRAALRDDLLRSAETTGCRTGR